MTLPRSLLRCRGRKIKHKRSKSLILKFFRRIFSAEQEKKKKKAIEGEEKFSSSLTQDTGLTSWIEVDKNSLRFFFKVDGVGWAFPLVLGLEALEALEGVDTTITDTTWWSPKTPFDSIPPSFTVESRKKSP
jgi:hypothetical protein